MTTAARTIDHILRSIEDYGFAIIDDCMSAEFVSAACQAIERAKHQAPVRRRQDAMYAIRNLLEAVPALRHLIAISPLPALMSEALGPGAFIVRAILFDKTGDANWAVPWHQDTTVAVRERIDAPGFGPWSVKEGVVHVQPPSDVLKHVLTARIHLDDCDAHSGALKVIAGSHCSDILEQSQIARDRQSKQATTCAVRSGGVLLMRPLLLHASSRAKNAVHRRVIHLEFAAQSLPCGLEWHRA